MAKRVRLPMLKRPKVVGDCKDGPRPCPWLRCRFNLLVDVLEDGSIVLNGRYRRPDGALRVILPKPETEERFLDEAEDAVESWFDEIDPPVPSCALDEARGQRLREIEENEEKGGMQLDYIAELLYVSRERVRQVEHAALLKVKNECERLGISARDMIEAWMHTDASTLPRTGGQE